LLPYIVAIGGKDLEGEKQMLEWLDVWFFIDRDKTRAESCSKMTDKTKQWNMSNYYSL